MKNDYYEVSFEVCYLYVAKKLKILEYTINFFLKKVPQPNGHAKKLKRLRVWLSKTFR
jgi:hypothetical protein